MVLQKTDFIQIEFTGKTKEGEIFDSNIREELEKMNSKIEARPFTYCLGEDMFLKGIDDFLIGKEIGEYEIELTPKKAFGNRDSKLLQIIPIKVFHKQKIDPIPGNVYNFDGKIAKIISVSGGRVMTDFNNPIAGKTVIYKVKVLKKIDNLNEKIRALNQFFFKRDIKFEIKNKKIIFEIEPPLTEYIKLFKEKYKEILNLDLEI
jgi:FKBP-type peptidyl-prolyl cis-trans isomerase 2